MPYSIPTAAELKARFPEFASVADPIVTNFIFAAANEVEPAQWIEKFYAPAIMYLAAHYMRLYELQLLANAQAAGGGGGGSGGEGVATFLSTMSWEDFEVSYRAANTSSTRSNTSISQGGSSLFYGRTYYGQLYDQLRRRVLPSVIVID